MDSRLAHRLLTVAAIAVLSVGTTTEAECANSTAKFETRFKPIFAKYCIGCHGPDAQENDLRIDQLNPDIVDGPDAGFWHEVLNQLNAGKMPPEDEPQLSEQELSAVTEWLEVELKKAADRRISTGGRQLMRRMSRYEYQYTLEDLLGIALDYTAHVPGDLSGEDGLKTNATLLGMSPVLMESYLKVAEMALEEVIPDGPEKVFHETIEKLAVTTIRGQRKRKRGKNDPKGDKVNPAVIAPTPGFKQTAFAHDLSRKVTFNKRPFAGRFAIRVKVRGTAASDGRLPELTIHVGHRASGDYDPKKVMGRRMIEPSDEHQVVEFVGNIEDFPLGKKDGYYNGSGSHDVTHLSVWLWNTARPAEAYKPETKLANVDEPLLDVASVEFEGPLLGGYPSETARALLPERPASASDDEYARLILTPFLRRAFRRDVSDDEVAHAVASFRDLHELTGDFKTAIRKTMAMLLISPKFIYLVEPSPDEGTSRKLNAYELASRLSYFLWASMPDDELLALAASDELLKPAVLKEQVDRMRRDSKFQRFAKHFGSQWLGLSAMEHVAVNPSVYPQFSDEVRENLKQETLTFASHVFDNDLSCRKFISSNFAMLNRVVADHYGIDGIHGAHFRPVALRDDQQRGGVLTQGSILLIGSDGTESNPIYRGVWLKKRLLADPPPPPPPGAPPLEKKDTTQLTLKQQIELHREAPACARCHSRIDPWGIAFEEFDATGRRKSGLSRPIKFDAATTLPDGETVRGMPELQSYLLEHRSQELAGALARRMSSYALGRQLEFSDTQMIEGLTDRFIKDDLRPSSLIEAIATSEAFLTK